jgi:hypothetical protein
LVCELRPKIGNAVNGGMAISNRDWDDTLVIIFSSWVHDAALLHKVYSPRCADQYSGRTKDPRSSPQPVAPL